MAMGLSPLRSSADERSVGCAEMLELPSLSRFHLYSHRFQEVQDQASIIAISRHLIMSTRGYLFTPSIFTLPRFVSLPSTCSPLAAAAATKPSIQS